MDRIKVVYVGDERLLSKGKCKVVFDDDTFSEGNVFAVVEDKNGELVETSKKAVMYSGDSKHKVKFYIQEC